MSKIKREAKFTIFTFQQQYSISILNPVSKHLKFFCSKTILTAQGLVPLNLVSSYIDGSAIYGDKQGKGRSAADLLKGPDAHGKAAVAAPQRRAEVPCGRS